jgi:predicted nucleic acid-binding protein
MNDAHHNKPLVCVDTNVWVAYYRTKNPAAASTAIKDKVFNKQWLCGFSEKTIDELSEVLSRPKFAFAREELDRFLLDLGGLAIWQETIQSCPMLANDPNDQLWLDLLHSLENANALITINLKDFKDAIAAGYPIVDPPNALRLGRTDWQA